MEEETVPVMGNIQMRMESWSNAAVTNATIFAYVFRNVMWRTHYRNKPVIVMGSEAIPLEQQTSEPISNKERIRMFACLPGVEL